MMILYRLCKTGSLRPLALKQAVDTAAIEGFGHVDEKLRRLAPFAEVPGFSISKAGQLQGRSMSVSKPEMLVS
jgi:hypothetical protein